MRKHCPIFSVTLHVLYLLTSALLFLLSSKIDGIRSMTYLMQYLKVAFLTLCANQKYTGGICFSNLSVIRPPLVVVRDEKQTSFLLVFINKLFLVSRTLMVLSKSTTDRVIAFIANSFSSSVFSIFPLRLVTLYFFQQTITFLCYSLKMVISRVLIHRPITYRFQDLS